VRWKPWGPRLRIEPLRGKERLEARGERKTALGRPLIGNQARGKARGERLEEGGIGRPLSGNQARSSKSTPLASSL
jgi:hypothetical protein